MFRIENAMIFLNRRGNSTCRFTIIHHSAERSAFCQLIYMCQMLNITTFFSSRSFIILVGCVINCRHKAVESNKNFKILIWMCCSLESLVMRHFELCFCRGFCVTLLQDENFEHSLSQKVKFMKAKFESIIPNFENVNFF